MQIPKTYVTMLSKRISTILSFSLILILATACESSDKADMYLNGKNTCYFLSFAVAGLLTWWLSQEFDELVGAIGGIATFVLGIILTSCLEPDSLIVIGIVQKILAILFLLLLIFE